MEKEKTLDIVGYFLFFFWIVLTIIQFYLRMFSTPLWFCNFTVAALAFACFQRSLNMFYFFLAMGLPFQTPWITDWTIYYFTGYSFFDLNGFYAGVPNYYFVLTFIRHALTVPFIFVLLFLFKPKKPSKKALVKWVLAIFTIMIFSYLLGRDYNVNCAHFPCAAILSNTFYGFWYFIGWTIFITLLSFIFLLFVIMPLHRIIHRISWKP